MKAEAQLRSEAKKENFRVIFAKQTPDRKMMSEGVTLKWKETAEKGYRMVYYSAARVEEDKKERFSIAYTIWLEYLKQKAIEQGEKGVLVKNPKGLILSADPSPYGYINYFHTPYEDKEAMRRLGIDEWTDMQYISTECKDQIQKAYHITLQIAKMLMAERAEDPTFAYSGRLLPRYQLDDQVSEQCVHFQFYKMERKESFYLVMEPEMHIVYHNKEYHIDEIADAANMAKGFLEEVEKKQKMKHILSPPRKEFDRVLQHSYRLIKRLSDSVHAHLIEKYDVYDVEKWMKKYGSQLDYLQEKFYDLDEEYVLYRIMDTYLLIRHQEYEVEGEKILLMSESRKEAQAAYREAVGEAKKREMDLKLEEHFEKMDKKEKYKEMTLEQA